MARLARLCPKGIPQHIIQRGNNRSICFCSEGDRAFYAQCLKQFAIKYKVSLHAWVFMTNHVHLLATPQSDDGISKMMQAIGRMYVRYFNQSYKRSGTLWEGRFKSCLIESERYLLQCYRYIELNPVTAGMVYEPSEYAWSSYRCNALGKYSEMLSPHAEYLLLGKTDEERQKNYRALFERHLDQRMITDIREATSKGMALGSEKFKEDIELTFKRRVVSAKPGRPRMEK